MILIVGIIGGIGNGISQPLLCIVFGDLIDSMGSLAKIWERLSPPPAFKRTALQPEKPIYPKMEKEKQKLTQTRFCLFVKKIGVYLFLWLVGLGSCPHGMFVDVLMV